MRKRCICLILAAVLAVLSACAGPGEKSRAKDGIYASCGNYNFTIYKGLSAVHSIRFYLTCEKPLPEGTEVRVDMDAEYSYVLEDITPETITAADYPYGLYCCARGMDFEKLKKLETKATEAQAAWQADPEKEEAYTAALKRLTQYRDQYLEDYEAMMAENPKPEFYHYLVDIRCKDATGEPKIRQAQLVAGDWCHTVDIGDVRVTQAPVPDNFSQGITGRRLAVQGGAESPWLPGVLTIDAVKFDVDEDVTLTNACFYGDATAKVNCMELTVTAPSGEAITTLWKPGDTLQLRKGETVAGTVSFGDENLNAAEYGSSTVLMLEFDRGGETTVLTCSFSLFRRRNPQEVYLWAFQKADVRGYYQYLYGAA